MARFLPEDGSRFLRLVSLLYLVQKEALAYLP
jgi:hypothetical protein